MVLLLIEIFLILINFTLIAIVYKGQRTLISKLRSIEVSFITFVISMNVWIIIQALYDYTTRPDQINDFRLLINLGLISSLAMVYSFWIFMSQFAKQKLLPKKLLGHSLVAVAATAIGIITQPVYAVVEGGVLTFAFKPVLYGALTAYLLFYFIGGVRYLVLKKYWAVNQQLLRTNRRRLISGFIIALALIVFGNTILPIVANGFSDKAVNAMGNIFLALGATALSFSSAFSVFNLGVFNLRKFILRTIMGAIAYLIPAGVIVILLSLAAQSVTSLSEINTRSLSSQVIYVLFVMFSSFVVIGMRKYIDAFIGKVFDAKQFNGIVFSSKVEQLIKTEITQKLLQKYAQLLKVQMGLDRVMIYVSGEPGSDLAEFHALADTIGMKKPSIERSVIAAELDRVKKLNTYVIMDFMNVNAEGDAFSSFDYVLQYEQNQMRGAILLGAKLNGQRYYIDELAAIRKSFLEIQLAMQNVFRIEKLVAFNQTLEDKIVIATKQLRRSNEKLKALDEAKDEFISMASHQLRTPLTSIKGYISLIMDGDMGKVPVKQKKMLQEAFSSSQRMVYLISDLLNVSRLKTGKFLIEPTDVFLPEVVEEEIDQVKEMAEVKNITIHYQKPKIFTHLELDDMKIRQVIMNFIDNAIHYTPEGGDINVILEETSMSVKFTVVDTGIGVPVSEQHHLFTKFYRAGNARKARPDGTGLGLFMAKKVIVASGGSIVFSSSEGKGSTFGFNFPKTTSKA